jgi:hypothetical protein
MRLFFNIKVCINLFYLEKYKLIKVYFYKKEYHEKIHVLT